MKEIFKAFYSRFASEPENEFHRLVSGRFFYSAAPQETEFPYAIYFAPGAVSMDTFSERMDDFSIQVSIFSKRNSSTEALDILQACCDLYDGSQLMPEGYSGMLLSRNFQTPPFMDLEADNWQAVVEFQFFASFR